MMDTSKDFIPYVLSKILDFYFVGTKEEVDMRRSSIYLSDSLNSVRSIQWFTAGGTGDGFHSTLCSDIDDMLTHSNVIVIYPDMYHIIANVGTNKTVLLIREADCRPGYVNLEIGQIGQYIEMMFMAAIVPVFNSAFLSSDIYREEIIKKINRQGTDALSTGPSTKLHVHAINKTGDVVRAFHCITWPNDANEWLDRPRVFGWPSDNMVEKIRTYGCHIVPIGDKCSDDTLLQWRISFVVAERCLTHSLTHIQFKVYGLLKYLLRQIKYRMKQDIGDDDILCSYFMKTLIFFCVENSPQSLWQEKNIFECFWFCFTTFLDWVYSGYCPNYFIPANNMFQRKVHGQNKLKLLNILGELHQMNWRILHLGTAYQPSIWERIHRLPFQEQLIHRQTPLEMEYRRDLVANTCIRRCFGGSKKVDQISNSMKMTYKLQGDTDEFIFYAWFLHLLRDTAVSVYEEQSSTTGNKAKYTSLRKCKYWLTHYFGTEILHLATFYYQTGNYRKAIKLCRDVTLSTNTLSIGYRDMYCGKGYSTIQKVQKTFAKLLIFGQETPQFCPDELHPELRSHLPYAMGVPPEPYAMFLSFLCHHILGDFKECYKVLYDLESERCDENEIRHIYWIVHTLIGICYQTMGDYSSALQAYRDSLRVSKTYGKKSSMERINALQSHMMG